MSISIAYYLKHRYARHVFIAVIAVLAAKDQTILGSSGLLVPLMALCAGGGAGDGGGGGAGDGGGAGGSTGEGGTASANGTVGGGCGNPGASSSGSGSSTPFLCTWNGSAFVFENDFLFGNPTSLVRNAEEGIQLYENKAIIPDLYRLQNNIQLKDGHFVAQIKEIEPEESFIDHLALLRAVYPREAELVIDSKFQHIRAFEKKALETMEGVTHRGITLNGIDISSTAGNTENLFPKMHDHDGYFINADSDVIEVKGRVEDKNRDVYLLLRAHYRDWTLGEIFNVAKTKQYVPIQELFGSSPKTLMKGAALVLSILILSVVTAVGSLLRSSPSDKAAQEAEKLARAFEIPRAYADTPAPPSPPGGGRSLIVEYWNGTAFEEIEVFSSIRYYQPSLNTIAVPARAVQSSGEVRLKITATHRHKVHFAGLVAPEKHLTVRTEQFHVAKAFHRREGRDYADVLNQQYSKEYLHTIPADVVDVSFKVGEPKVSSEEQYAYIVRAGGVYTYANEETQHKAGNWVSRLDPEAQSFLREMYALRADRDASETPTLF